MKNYLELLKRFGLATAVAGVNYYYYRNRININIYRSIKTNSESDPTLISSVKLTERFLENKSKEKLKEITEKSIAANSQNKLYNPDITSNNSSKLILYYTSSFPALITNFFASTSAHFIAKEITEAETTSVSGATIRNTTSIDDNHNNNNNKFDVTTYLFAPNMVNDYNQYVGQVYKLFLEISRIREIIRIEGYHMIFKKESLSIMKCTL